MLRHATEAFGEPVVTLNGFFDFIGRFGCAEAIGNISRMAKGAGIMALQDVGIERFLLPAADGFEPIRVVVFRSGELIIC